MTFVSTSVVRSRGESDDERTASETIGMPADVELLDDRVLDAGRQVAADGRDLRARILRGAVGVHLELELDDDLRHAFARGRADVAHAGDRVDRFLDPLRHLALDRLGRGAGVDR